MVAESTSPTANVLQIHRSDISGRTAKALQVHGHRTRNRKLVNIRGSTAQLDFQSVKRDQEKRMKSAESDT